MTAPEWGMPLKVMQEQAARIADLQADLARVTAERDAAMAGQSAVITARDMMGGWWAEAKVCAEAAEAKVARLVEAIRPLAEMAERYDPEDGDNDLECWSGLAVPKIKHLRAARAALSDIKEGG